MAKVSHSLAWYMYMRCLTSRGSLPHISSVPSEYAGVPHLLLLSDQILVPSSGHDKGCFGSLR